MKTTDSVMREKIEKIVLKWSMGTLVLPPGANTTGEELTVQSISVKDLQKLYEDLSHSIAEARRELIDEIYDKGKGSANGIYSPFRAMDYFERLHYEQHKSDLLTGDNPERKV